MPAAAARPAGASADAGALRACVGALSVYDFAVADERGALRPLDALRSAEAPALYLTGFYDTPGRVEILKARPLASEPCNTPPTLTSTPLQTQERIGDWRATPAAGDGAAAPAVLVSGATDGRWYTLSKPTAEYAPLFAELRARLRPAPPRGFDSDSDEPLPALRPPPTRGAGGAPSAAPRPAAAQQPPPAPPAVAPVGFGDSSDDDDEPPVPPGLAAAPVAPPSMAPSKVAPVAPVGFGDSDDSDDSDGEVPPGLAAAPPPPPVAPVGFGVDTSESDEAPPVPPGLAAAAEPELSDLDAMLGSDDDDDAEMADAPGGGGGGGEPELSDVEALRLSDDDDELQGGAPAAVPLATRAGSPEGSLSGLSGLMSEDEAGAAAEGAAASSTITEPPGAAGGGAEIDDARSAPPPPGAPPGDDDGDDVDGDDMGDDFGGDEAAEAAEAAKTLDERWQANDTQCGVCDDGGDLLLCEGSCMRSFHPHCLGDEGMSNAAFEALKSSAQRWMCPACELGRHRCLQCLEEGTTGEPPAGSALRRVHKCSVFECSRFYHRGCSAAGGAAWGTPPPRRPGAQLPPAEFTCAQHACAHCSAGGDARGPLVRCRRCPAAFHAGCMRGAGIDPSATARPRRVWLNTEDAERAAQWLHDDVAGGEVETSLVYCLAHPMAPSDAQPARRRDVVFPEEMLHAAARVIAARDGRAAKCLGCGRVVIPKRAAPAAGPPEPEAAESPAAAAAGGARQAQLRAEARVRVLKALSVAAAGAKSAAEHAAALGDAGQCYRARAWRTVAPERLAEMEATLGAAARARERGDDAAAAALLSERLRSEHRASFLSLRVANAPWLYRTRYTSYGRHFTVPARLSAAAARAALFLRHGDTVIDFSAGANDWLPAVARRAAAAGLRGLSFRGFDVFPAANSFGFTEKDWFKVTRDDLAGAPGDRLVVGLNPPFGTDGALAAKFVDHAVQVLQPRLLILIVPRETPLPADYFELERNTRLAKGHAFYLPGSHDPLTHRPVEDWNKETPPFIIMQRADTAMPRSAAQLLKDAWRVRPERN